MVTVFRTLLILLSVLVTIPLNLLSMHNALNEECDIVLEQEWLRERCDCIIQQRGRKALVYATMMPLHEEIALIQALLDRGQQYNQQSDISGMTPLHYAVRNNHKKTIILLLSHGADIDMQDYDGNTPLHIAAMQKHSSIVTLLLYYGANVAIKNNKKETPKDLIEQWDSSLLQPIESNNATASINVEMFLASFADYMESGQSDCTKPRSLSKSIDLFDVLDQLG